MSDVHYSYIFRAKCKLSEATKEKNSFGVEGAKAYVCKRYTEKVQPHDSEVVQSSGLSEA